MSILDQLDREARTQERTEALREYAQMLGTMYDEYLKAGIPADVCGDLLLQYNAMILSRGLNGQSDSLI